MGAQNIRNFSIIAHIDHGKSTLADRLLELTGTIPQRKMRAQVLDAMDLERERGITIKMTPVRLCYGDCVLNLIDTPGHIDFSYEVSRALKAVEGVVLLVDATQGVQAQTLTVLAMAQAEGLMIIPVINKIDLPSARVEEAKAEIEELLGATARPILAVSAKTGAGVAELLDAIIARVPVPPPVTTAAADVCRALVFDYAYSDHRGVIVYCRVFEGEIKVGDDLLLLGAAERFTVLEVGTFRPEPARGGRLGAGEIGYVITGLKQPGRTKVGDTLTTARRPLPPVRGYSEPKPVVWASIYPASQDDYPLYRRSLLRLQLSDASLSFTEESSSVLGRGFRCGFLGLLHLEIVIERLRREFGLDLIVATPTIGYQIVDARSGRAEVIYSPHLFPEDLASKTVREPWVAAKIIVPPVFLSEVMKLLADHEAMVTTAENFGRSRSLLEVTLPLRELVRQFFDRLKSVSAGFASLSYRPLDYREAAVTRLDLLVGEKLVPAFSRIVSRRRLEREAETAVEKLHQLLPRQLIVVKIQARALGRIIASRSLPALRKDVTGYLYGGDITRKRKLWEKQKRGKKKMQVRGLVNIPPDVFRQMIASNE